METNIKDMINIAIEKKAPDEKYIYRKVQDLQLPVHIYYPEVKKESLIDNRKDLKPAIVLIHGGAWGARKDNSDWNGDYMNVLARYLALRGIISIIFSYRNVYNPVVDKDAFESGPQITDLYEDCLMALRYVRENAHTFGIDREKIVVLGDSAGGHLAACLGTLDIMRSVEDIKPYAVIACNPITDLTDEAWFKYIPSSTYNSIYSNLSRIERAKLISPLHNITKSTSETFVIHGTSDTVVLPSHSIMFYEKMQESGNRCKLELIEGAKHAFILPEYYEDKEMVYNAISLVDDYLVDKEILID